MWTRDFIAEATLRGGALRVLTILYEYTREFRVLRVERALKSDDVLHRLEKTLEERGAVHLQLPSGCALTALGMRWGWTEGEETDNLNQVPGLTSQVSRKSEPGRWLA